MRPICFSTVHFVFENETGIYRRHEWQYKMPRNVTGGSGHRSQRNSESNKTKSNNKIIDALIEDIATEAPEDVHIGRVMRRLGSGFMEVFYLKRVTIENTERLEDTLVRAPLKGGMRGRGKKDVWVDVGSVVVLANTGLGGTPWKIVGVLNDARLHGTARCARTQIHACSSRQRPTRCLQRAVSSSQRMRMMRRMWMLTTSKKHSKHNGYFRLDGARTFYISGVVRVQFPLRTSACTPIRIPAALAGRQDPQLPSIVAGCEHVYAGCAPSCNYHEPVREVRRKRIWQWVTRVLLFDRHLRLSWCSVMPDDLRDRRWWQCGCRYLRCH